MTKFASGGPVWAPGVDPTLPPREHRREVLYNIYEVGRQKKILTCSAISEQDGIGDDR